MNNLRSASNKALCEMPFKKKNLLNMVLVYSSQAVKIHSCKHRKDYTYSIEFCGLTIEIQIKVILSLEENSEIEQSFIRTCSSWSLECQHLH